MRKRVSKNRTQFTVLLLPCSTILFLLASSWSYFPQFSYLRSSSLTDWWPHLVLRTQGSKSIGGKKRISPGKTHLVLLSHPSLSLLWKPHGWAAWASDLLVLEDGEFQKENGCTRMEKKGAQRKQGARHLVGRASRAWRAPSKIKRIAVQFLGLRKNCGFANTIVSKTEN